MELSPKGNAVDGGKPGRSIVQEAGWRATHDNSSVRTGKKRPESGAREARGVGSETANAIPRDYSARITRPGSCFRVATVEAKQKSPRRAAELCRPIDAGIANDA